MAKKQNNKKEAGLKLKKSRKPFRKSLAQLLSQTKSKLCPDFLKPGLAKSCGAFYGKSPREA